MINQIMPDSINKQAFAPLQSNSVHYAISRPLTEDQKTAVKKDKKQELDKKESKLGLRIAEIGIFTALAAFAILKGAPRRWHNKLDRVYKNMEDKSAQIVNNKIKGNGEIFKFKMLQQLKLAAQHSKAIFNLAPLKDVLVVKALEKSPFWNDIGNKITDLFERISVRTSRNSYSKTMSRFDSMYAGFADANKKIPRSQAKIVEQKMDNIKKIYDESFCETARNKRLDRIKRHFDGYDDHGNINKKNSLKEKIWTETYQDLTKFYTKKTYQTFISEELASKEKMRLNNEVSIPKAKISNDMRDICTSTNRLLREIDTFIDPTDQQTRSIMKKISNDLKDYNNAVKVGKSTRSTSKMLIEGAIPNHLKELDKVLSKSKKYDAEHTNKVSDRIRHLSQIFKENKKGEIQEILEIYRQNMPAADYEKLKKKTYKTVNSLNRSTNLETDRLFDKIRDLKIGSAPKDTIGVLASLGVVGFGLTKAENADERVSVSLKYGIPTLGAVMIALYCTVGLISAGPSLLIGLASGLVMNKIGATTDNLRKKYQEKPLNLNNISIPTSILPIKIETKKTDKNSQNH